MVFGFEPLRTQCTYALGQALCAPCSVLNYRSPVPLPKFQMAPILSFLISSGSKKKEPRYVWVTPRPHTHTKCGLRFPPQYHISYRWGYYSAPLHIYKCFLKVLCPVRRSITTLDFVLLKDNNRALVARSGPEINSQACHCVLQGPHHNTRCWFAIQRFIFLIFRLETPKKGSRPTNLWTEPSLASLSTISFPHTPACPGTWYSPSVCRVEISFTTLLALLYQCWLSTLSIMCLGWLYWINRIFFFVIAGPSSIFHSCTV
jgi:hypothetical protein